MANQAIRLDEIPKRPQPDSRSSDFAPGATHARTRAERKVREEQGPLGRRLEQDA